jgi:class 3 adenylate cyclase
MAFREFHFHWIFDLKSSPESLWPFISDTNRFNRDTGVPKLQIDTRNKPMRNARRKVRLSIYGMDIEWEEQPFEWVRPLRFGIDRVYSKGPMGHMRVLAELTPGADGGTRVTYDVWATPRNFLGLVAIPLQIKLQTYPRFRTAFNKYDELASAGTHADLAQQTTSLSASDHHRLIALGEKLLKESADVEANAVRMVVDRLLAFIEHADDFAVARIRPYQLADDWQQPRRLVLETCLRATRIGLLDLQWDLLCPLCRGAKQSGSSLQEIETHLHCSTCKVDFTVSFDRFVELTFRPNAGVRRVDVQEFCVGSPQRSPHVVAQQLLSPRAERIVTLPLESGGYRVRALELQGSQVINVSSEGETTVGITLSENGWSDSVLQVAERSSFQLKNETDTEQLLILERMIWSDQAATAAEVTALQVFRDLFATEALRPGEQISVGTLTVLFTDLRHSTQLYREIGDATAFGRVMNHFDVLKKAISERDGALVKTIGDAVMAVFRNPVNALLAMLDVQQVLACPSDGGRPLQLKAGLHTGPCIAVTLNERLDYFGSTVNMAARLEGLSSGADVIISRVVFEDPEVSELMQSGEYEAEPFEMSLKGFEEESAELWRVSKTRKFYVEGVR